MAYFLYGAYGTGNLGDDLLLRSALQQHSDKECRVIAYGKPYMANAPDHIDHFEFIKEPEKYLSAGDTLAFAGGGLFWAASHAEDMASAAAVAKRKGCDVRIERIGAQGVHCNLEAAKRLCADASFISVRDHNSVDLMKRLSVADRAVYEPDFVLVMQDLPGRRRAVRPAVTVNHSATTFFADEKHRKKALHIYAELSAAFNGEADFFYLPHTRHFNVMSQNDVVFGEYFWQASRGRIQPLPFPKTVEELLEHYASMSGVIGWRYHLQVTATLFGIPRAFLGQLGEHKYGAFAREHKIPMIDFDKSTAEIIASAKRFVSRVIDSHRELAA